ncbi:MAG: transporter substrate-binding domain-containing protein [Oleiphilaceae bacterium]|nr:transporter substrate-binding domain-containing protein [Oleiphilaceae bacterium]
MRSRLIGVIAALWLVPVIAISDTLLCSKLSATGNAEYPPYLWRESDSSKRLLGANTIIFDEIAKRLGVEIDLQHTGPWSRAQQEVRSGRIDLLAGAFITIPRQQWMDYVYPAFLQTTSVVWVRSNHSKPYTRREDLIDQVGVTVINNSFGQSFDAFAQDNLQISTVANLQQAFSMLDLGRVDYLLYELNPAKAYTAQWGMSDEVNPLSPPISSEGLFLTVSHKSSCNNGTLRGRLAKIVGALVSEGFTEKALQQGLALWQQMQSKK